MPALGPRGEGWVVLQFVLIAVVLVAALAGPGWEGAAASALRAVGVVLGAAGLVLAAVAARALGPALTPFPRPSGRARVVERGPYGIVRHPIYTAGLLVLAGLSLALSPVALVPTAVLALVWALKARVEERFLLEALPAYAAYMERTRYRLVPYVY